MFVHGLLVNGGLWRNVAPPLSEHFRCIVPDWPLDAHTLAMEAGADLTPPGLARLVADFMDALDLRDVTLVGNDTGGAISQMVIAHRPERVGRLVLTNCDAFEHFPPPLILPFKWGAFVPGFAAALAHALRLPTVGRLLYALVARRQPGRAVLDSYFVPLIRKPDVRRDVTKVMHAVSKSDTLEAARLPGVSQAGPDRLGRGRLDLPDPGRRAPARDLPRPSRTRGSRGSPARAALSPKTSRGSWSSSSRAFLLRGPGPSDDGGKRGIFDYKRGGSETGVAPPDP